MINHHIIVIIWEECVIKWQSHAQKNLRIPRYMVVSSAIIVTLGNSIHAMFYVTSVSAIVCVLCECKQTLQAHRHIQPSYCTCKQKWIPRKSDSV